MLTNEQEYILRLLRESLKKAESECPAPADCRAAAGMIAANSILLTVFNKLPAELKTRLNPKYLAAVRQSVLQAHEGEKILRALDGAGLSCIALKGWELRKLYPEPTMRQMADLDILVKPYDFGLIKRVMEQLGYAGGRESSWKHDNFRKQEVTVEMHKRLTDDSGAIRAWENGLWDRATAVEGNICKMSPEDYYIFHFIHLYKDFLNGSLGLRRIADTWLLQSVPMDTGAVMACLEKFGMLEFHDRMVKLSRVTMGEVPMDEDCEVLLNHAFAHGIYGSGKSYKAGRIAAMSKSGSIKTGKLRSALAAVFLPYGRMKAQFPILNKWPILLPFCRLKRIVHFLKGDTKKYRRMLDYSDVKPEDYEEMKRFFKAGGIK